MSRIKGKDTEIEKITRSVLHRMGFRFRKHGKGLPGKPDIVMAGFKTIIFVHGCFWHQHPGCKKAYKVKHNDNEVKRRWWQEKLEGNVVRDKRNIKALKKEGWNVGIIWECQSEYKSQLESRLQKIINKSGGYQGRISYR